MQRRTLGSSGFEISRIGLGTWAIGGHMWGGQDEAQSVAAIHAAVDHGVNWIDTAPIYGSGVSEEVVGRAVKQLPASSRPLIFTKFGLGVDSNAPNRSASAADVAAECDASLRRLAVDRIDLYQLHWPAPQPIAETAAACRRLLDAGKIRAIGVSNFSVAQLEEWRATGAPLHADQPPYSILRPAVKHDVIPWCAAHDVGVISYSPLFRGMLFGTWGTDKTFAADDGRSTHKDYAGARFQRHLQAIEEIRAVAARGGLSVPQLSVGVLLDTPGLTGVIAGARNARQGALIANLGVSVTPDQSRAVWAIADRLARDLEAIPV
ncbi:MAG TPA: aldo/keto reductase [Vicinamibacterales bacterium]|nr:aldo/keto reductase [Vicinamibacterales bacterium]